MGKRPHQPDLVVGTAQRGECALWPTKVRYSERRTANINLTAARERYGKGHAIQVYKCPSCRGFHISHVRKSDWPAHRRRGAEPS